MPLTDLLKIKKINLSQIANLVILLIAGIVALNIYQRQNKKITSVLKLHKDQSEKNELLLQIDDINKSIESYKENFGYRDRREIINMITNIARSSGVNILALRPQEKAKKVKSEIYDKVFFDVDIQANSYHEIGKFISRLESNPVIFIVESIVIEPTSDTKRTKKTELEIELEKLGARLTISQLFFK
jgi:Tfp pilus assembly protein PilO